MCMCVRTFALMLYLLYSRNIIVGVAGVTADANSLVSYARNCAQDHLLNYNENMPCERLVKQVCNLKQGYTLHGGQLIFCSSFSFISMYLYIYIFLFT